MRVFATLFVFFIQVISHHEVASFAPVGFATTVAGNPLGLRATEFDDDINSCNEILCKAAETKAEDPDLVLKALEDLEKNMRKKRKEEGESVAENVVENLTGDWRLIFTTGTKKTQEKYNAKINYFPLKAVQSFDTTMVPYQITNAIYVGDFALLKFFGTFDFDLKRSKLEFDFNKLSILQFFDIGLQKDEAAKIGASTGLGSEGNIKLAEKNKGAFFNWISADEKIATARGGGGGLALWKRVQDGE